MTERKALDVKAGGAGVSGGALILDLPITATASLSVTTRTPCKNCQALLIQNPFRLAGCSRCTAGWVIRKVE